jgi:hypothetical protein
MKQNEAEAAAGVSFDGSGDGFWYSTKLPDGYPHDYVGLGSSTGTVICVGASILQATVVGRQTISTPEGFRLGDSVQRLLAVYGSRAHYVPAPSSGMTTEAGYVVAESGGTLAFVVDGANRRVIAIAGGAAGVVPPRGGGAGIDPNSCPG